MASYPDRFTGFQVDNAETWTEFHKREFEPRPFGPHDVDIKIHCCGICGTDVHTINGSWDSNVYPIVVGHEIVGEVVKVGPEVTLVKEGQRVGVGTQAWACLDCRQCKAGNDTYCRHKVSTYGSRWPGTDFITQGGYASHVRTDENWVFAIPDAISSVHAAPLLCAGVTVYSPLVRNGSGPGKKVGIVGIGGLGHLGIMFAHALGAEVWAISRSRSKEADAVAMGAAGLIATAEPDWADPHNMTFDLIINTASSFDGFEMKKYLSMLDVHGRWISVGLPGGSGITIRNQDMLPNGCLIGSSYLGSRSEMVEMLQLAAEKGIKPWVEEVPISSENLAAALQRVEGSGVRYRFCLTGYGDAFGEA